MSAALQVLAFVIEVQQLRGYVSLYAYVLWLNMAKLPFEKMGKKYKLPSEKMKKNTSYNSLLWSQSK